MIDKAKTAAARNIENGCDAETALIAYAGAKEQRDVERLGDTYQENLEWLIDLLTDLRHWARVEDVDFGKALELSETHFNSELDEEIAGEAGAQEVANDETQSQSRTVAGVPSFDGATPRGHRGQ